MCDKDCTTRDWNKDKAAENNGQGGYDHYIYKVKVFQDGEELGALSTSPRYRRNVGNELVYGIESFRISKERGRGDTTYSKDLKVALRTAKKVFIARANNELYTHIFNNVRDKLNNLLSSTRNTVRYALDTGDEAMAYAKAAYQAHKEGKTTVEMPVKLASVRDYDTYINKCAELDCVTNIWDAFQAKEGYTVKVLEDGKIIIVNLSDGVITKYDNIDVMPPDIANKFVMFKVLKELEPYEHLGVMFEDKFFFIVK
jgi:formylmethanofuran dehydrogenase subunit D